MAERGRDLRPGTRVVHAGRPKAKRGEPLLPGPVLAAPFHLAGDVDGATGYGRYSNPTWELYESAISDLEGGPAVVFASGMAAAAAVLLPLLLPGDLLVAPSDCYFTVRTLLAEHLVPRGVEVRLVPTAELGPESVAGAALLWVETPSNPMLDACDIRSLAAACRSEGALLAVDNTLATALLQRPLELGADLSMSSATKALSGHGDLLLGHVACRDDELAEPLRLWRSRAGAIAGPFETWLAHRSLPTLGVRLERQCATAQSLAEMLSRRPEVRLVRYPGLPGDPAHTVAAAQMDAFGPVVSFDLGSADRAQAFLSGLDLVIEATSFGGVHSSAERRARWGGDDVPEGLVRFSVGCEEEPDLVADVQRALESL